MNLEILSALIAARIPEMSRDSATNNAEIIKGMLREEIDRQKSSPPPPGDDGARLNQLEQRNKPK